MALPMATVGVRGLTGDVVALETIRLACSTAIMFVVTG